MSGKQAHMLETQARNFERIWPMSTQTSARMTAEIGRERTRAHMNSWSTQIICRFEYYATASFIKIALFGQIIIAAAVTATSAAAGPRIALTVLGHSIPSSREAQLGSMFKALPDRLLSYGMTCGVHDNTEDLER